MKKMTILHIKLTEKEIHVLYDALNTAETTYRYGQQWSRPRADVINELRQKLRKAIDGEEK